MPLATNNCPPGYYCPTGSTSSQADCPPGFYCPSGSQQPTVCPIGSYCQINSSSPTQCPPGTYCSIQSMYAHDCAAGTYCPDGINQNPCPQGQRSAPGSSACSSTITVANGSITNSGEIVCNDGFTLYNGLCYPNMRPSRPAFINATNTMIVDTIDLNSRSVSMCPPCYSLSGFLCTFSSTCNPVCQAGYVPNYNKACVPCPIGYYSLENLCVPVEDGYFSNEVGGEFPCPPGTWSNNLARVCTLCLAGTYSYQSRAVGIEYCHICQPGTYSSAGASYCTICPSGTHSTVSGATSSATCTTCVNPSCATNQYTYGCINPQDFQLTCNNCSNPTTGTLEYVSGLCTTGGNTIMSAAGVPTSGTYYSSFDQGVYNRTADTSTWVFSNCTCLNGCDFANLQYVASTSDLCQYSRDTIVSKYPQCPANQYYSDISGAQSSYFSVASGSPPFKNCQSCNSALSFPNYVSKTCSNVEYTFTTQLSRVINYFYSGFNTGSSYVLGTPGVLTPCSLPGASQYTSAVCSNVSDTQISTFSNLFSCPAGTTYFTKGTISGNVYSLGVNSVCSTCPTYQWKNPCRNTNVTSNVLGRYNVKTPTDTSFKDPRSLAYDPVTGNVYVSNGIDGTIYVGVPVVGSVDYQQRLFYGKSGTKGALDVPTAIKYDGGYLYVFESGLTTGSQYELSKISIANPTTKNILTNFTYPYMNEFAIKSGNVYIPNYGYQNIWRVDTTTGISTQFIGPTNPINQPYSVAFDSAGSLFVADIGNYTIQKYSSAGVFQSNVYSGTLSTFIPKSISIDSNDNIIISNSVLGKIQILLQNGTISDVVGAGGAVFSYTTANGLGSAVNLGTLIKGTTIDKTGNVFFVSGFNTVSKIY